MSSMSRSFTCSLTLILLLAFAHFAIVSSKIQQKQQQLLETSCAAVLEVEVSPSNSTNGSVTSFQITPSSKVDSSSEEVGDSLEDDNELVDDDEPGEVELEEKVEEKGEENNATTDDDDDENRKVGESNASEEDEGRDREIEGENTDEYENELRMAAAATAVDKPKHSDASSFHRQRPTHSFEFTRLRKGNAYIRNLYAESLLKLLKRLSENPQRWKRVHQLLNNIKADLDYLNQLENTKKRLDQISNLFPSTPLTRPTKNHKRKKKNQLQQQKLETSTLTTKSTPILTVTEPASTTMSRVPMHSPQWRLIAGRLLHPSWNQRSFRRDDADIAKVHYSVPVQSRTIASSMRTPLDDKERNNPKALNSEGQALMLKAARKFSQPESLHYGTINTLQRISSQKDLDDNLYEEHQVGSFGHLVSSPSQVGYFKSRERIPLKHKFAGNQKYLPRDQEYAMRKPWQHSWDWHQLAPDQQQQQQQQPQKAKSTQWHSWNTERDCFVRLEGEKKNTARKWEQVPHWKNLHWNRQHFWENLPPWLKEKVIQRIIETPDFRMNLVKSRKYKVQKEHNVETNQINNSGLKNKDELEEEDDSKNSPKLMMKTWNSLTSDPATWPFKLPSAKPWPKDKNGRSYNPNAELVRKLSLYSKNDGLLPNKNSLKELKMEKQENSEKSEVGRQNRWTESDEHQLGWLNELKLHNNCEEDETENLSKSDQVQKCPRSENIRDWKPVPTSSSVWPGNKWKQFVYHKVMARPISKTGLSYDKPNKSAFIAVSAPKYSNDWKKNDIEELDQTGVMGAVEPSVDPNHPSNQIRINVRKKNYGPTSNVISVARNIDKPPALDILESQLQGLKDKSSLVLLEVNVSIKNSTSRHTERPVLVSKQEKITKMFNSTNFNISTINS